MKTTFETIKRGVSIVVKAHKCEEGEYVITPTLIYTKEKPRKKDDSTTVAKKSFLLGWIKGYVEIELTTEKPIVAKKD